ncbi:MAG: ompa/motb domain protein [Ignavibacteria bacterium]|nr:ompa/motb domain protein [Ignavibacteria bacterium]
MNYCANPDLLLLNNSNTIPIHFLKLVMGVDNIQLFLIKLIRKSFTLIYIFSNLFLLNTESLAEDSKDLKVRLPDNINSYPKVLQPVVNLNGNEIFFDRKEHPHNTGGIKDKDEIWYSYKLSGNGWSEPEILSGLNTESSDVIFTLLPDGKKALAWTSYLVNGEKKYGFCFITKYGKEWGNPVPLNIKNFYNKSPYFYASLSDDEQFFIMSLERDDSFGNLDLYISVRETNSDNWSEPLNLGSEINTTGMESAPYIAYDGKSLYFSSNGRGGFGGMDLFVSKQIGDSWRHWSEPGNLERSINSKFDENSVWLSALGDTIYYISADTINFQGIYYSPLPKQFQPDKYMILKGNVRIDTNFSKSNLSLGNYTIFNGCENDKFGIPDKFEYNFNDTFVRIIHPDNNCFSIKAEGFAGYNEKFIINSENSSIQESTFYLKPNIDNDEPFLSIYFDFDSDSISYDMLKLIKEKVESITLKNNFDIEILGYADEQGSLLYNFELSRRRAENVGKEIIKAGINSTKIHTYGKGVLNINQPSEKKRRADIFKREKK